MRARRSHGRARLSTFAERFSDPWRRDSPRPIERPDDALGYSRRGFYHARADERLSQFLDAHERAFEHFGGHTREHLYNRARTVCYPDGEGKIVWNPTFKAFAEYWGFEPRLCRPYRARTKGKVESGVKYLKRNFLRGRTFIDIVDLQTQLDLWNAEIADQRIHGTTHEQPLARFEAERTALIATHRQPSFALAARRSRIVASDYLVSFQTNRYSTIRADRPDCRARGVEHTQADR